MIQLNEKYNRADFLDFIINVFLTDFKKDIRPVNTGSLSSIKKVEYLGESKDLNLQVFEFLFEGSSNKRVTLTKDAFSVMKSHATFRTLAIFHSADNQDWRFSLMTATPEPTEKGKVSLSYSNPKRLSFFLGPNAKINTPTKFLLNKGKVINFEDLKNRFSIEVVNKEFYKEISQAFTKLVSGLLKLPSTQDKSQTNLEFAVRLIGRVIFCWFLREKKSQAGMSLMPKELLSLEAVKTNEDYYHKILEPIFFEILNKTVRSRRDDFAKKPFSSVPYLNGGLFSPQDDDYYKRSNDDYQSQFHNTLEIPDNWFKDFFEILETYNFTIDENTSYDEELSIDPEMLGRIFENLLAEINPETGESARKSTGSYYTPRVIVNYMIDESLLLYLKEQTGIDEAKLKAIISYDLDDDLENPVTTEEKEKIIDALEKVKILDPACGSGAFPIGALQKIVFILQQTDPEGHLWFKKQIQNTSPEIRRVVEREFSNKNFDYIRKLGIIRENIYGVDIQSIATEISRLRCFLTLIVEERIQDEAENRGIEPLPNLDFKFVTANSLIGLPKTDQPQQAMFDDYQKIDDLKDIRDQYFNASGLEREQLKTEFVMAQKRLVDQLIKEHGFMGVAKAELTQKLTDWEPFTHKSTSWFDPEWMFGIKEGFDIVIANPPYIGQKGNKTLFDQMKNSPHFEKKMDFWYFFLHLAYELNKSDGVTTFITTSYWTSAQGGKKIRKRIVNDYSIIEWINFNENKIFEAGVHANVFILKKQPPSHDDIKCTIYKNKYEESFFEHRDKEINFVTKQALVFSQWTGFVHFLPPSTLSIINKLIVGSEKLSDDKSEGKSKKGITSGKKVTDGICNINQGLVTGKDRSTDPETIGSEGIFILNEDEVQRLHLNSSEQKKIKNFYKNSNIKRYYVSPKSSRYLLYINDIDSEIELRNFPNLYAHISKYKNILKKRSINGVLESAYKKGKWWALTTDRPNINFSGENVVFPQRSSINTFGYSNSELYAASDVFYISLNKESYNLKYILSIINCRLIYFWLYHMGKRKGEILELTLEPVQFIPIKKISTDEQKQYIEIVDKILAITKSDDYLQDSKKQSDVNNFEKQIDKLVYKLYGLTPEERSVVEDIKQLKI